MEKYDSLGTVGEGSYGMVLKCRHRKSGQLVAIKKFLESEDDKQVKKIAMREVEMLRMLRHDNLVNLLEVFRRKKRLYLVFEYVDHTLLDDLEVNELYGLSTGTVRQYLWQIITGVDFCHSKNIIHRDVKPENILVSKEGIVKLCDFGFARIVASSARGEVHTDYVATRWYRAPELLVGDTSYGKAVDVWAIGCLLAEMLTAEPLFPGNSDIDQLHHIVKCLGNLTRSHTEVFLRNSLFVGIRLPQVAAPVTLARRLPTLSASALELLEACLKLEPGNRDTCEELLNRPFFEEDNFSTVFPQELKAKIRKVDAKRGAKAARKAARDSPTKIGAAGPAQAKKKKQPDDSGGDGAAAAASPMSPSRFAAEGDPTHDVDGGAEMPPPKGHRQLTLPQLGAAGANMGDPHPPQNTLPKLGVHSKMVGMERKASLPGVTAPLPAAGGGGSQSWQGAQSPSLAPRVGYPKTMKSDSKSLKPIPSFAHMTTSQNRPPLGAQKKPQHHLPKGNFNKPGKLS
mmetsp:Transcript_30020/g.78758  ORF Transcript_30020/g.78758 Transcript_30020/m.78758 type:complete len:513 (-) Transcript_30020:2725-4263(-)